MEIYHNVGEDAIRSEFLVASHECTFLHFPWLVVEVAQIHTSIPLIFYPGPQFLFFWMSGRSSSYAITVSRGSGPDAISLLLRSATGILEKSLMNIRNETCSCTSYLSGLQSTLFVTLSEFVRSMPQNVLLEITPITGGFIYLRIINGLATEIMECLQAQKPDALCNIVLEVLDSSHSLSKFETGRRCISMIFCALGIFVWRGGLYIWSLVRFRLAGFRLYRPTNVVVGFPSSQ